MKTNILEENIDQNISVQLYGELRNIHISVWRIAYKVYSVLPFVKYNHSRFFCYYWIGHY